MLEHCYNSYSQVYNRIEHSFERLMIAIGSPGGSIKYTDSQGFSMELSWIDAWIEFTRTLYDFSHVFKSCYERSEHNAYVFWLFANHYETFSNYLVNLIPNALAYAMYYGQWADKIEELDGVPGKELELYYVYAVIIRKLFLFDYVPDAFNDDLQPLDFFGEDEDP